MSKEEKQALQLTHQAKMLEQDKMRAKLQLEQMLASLQVSQVIKIDTHSRYVLI